MKSIKTLFAILAFSFVLTSCSKDDDNDGGGGSGTLTAKVAGANFKSTLAVQAVATGSILAIGGTGSDGQINVNVNGFSGPGTYNVSSGNMIANYTTTSAPFKSWSASMIIGSGSVVITEYSATGRVKGTFNFTGTNPDDGTSKVVTDGQFDIEM